MTNLLKLAQRLYPEESIYLDEYEIPVIFLVGAFNPLDNSEQMLKVIEFVSEDMVNDWKKEFVDYIKYVRYIADQNHEKILEIAFEIVS